MAMANPEAKSREKLELTLKAILKIRQKSKIKKDNKIETPKKPVSSATAEKIKSVCGSGKNPYWVWDPAPMPCPKILPEPIATFAWFWFQFVPNGSVWGETKLAILTFW